MSETNTSALLTKTGTQAPPYPDRNELLNALGYQGEIYVRNLTGVGTALDVNLPFDPAFAILFNETAGPTVFFGLSTKAAATGIGIVLATALVAANGFTFVPKAGAVAAKLTLGTALQTTSDVLRLVVFGVAQNPGLAVP